MDITKFQVPGQTIWQNLILNNSHNQEALQRTTNMDLLPTDAVVASYPKAGTTLLQEVVWLLRHHADVTTAQRSPNFVRVPFIDINDFGSRTGPEIFADQPHPRTMKTHVPYHLLPKSIHNQTSKVIAIFRNPKDILVSFFYFHRTHPTLGNFPGTWNDFFDYFKRNGYLLLYGNPVDHMLTYWNKRSDPNVCIVFYENLVRHKTSELRKLAKFLDVELTEKEIEIITDFTSFNNMRECPATSFQVDKIPDFEPGHFKPKGNNISPFLRKGEVGDWKNYFNEEQNQIMEEMFKYKLEGTGLEFIFE